MSEQTRRVEKMDAPELGEEVVLEECTVDELLPLFEVAQQGKNGALMLATLAVSLRVNGQRFSEEEIRALPASKFRALMRLGAQALRINSIIPEEEEDETKNA